MMNSGERGCIEKDRLSFGCFLLKDFVVFIQVAGIRSTRHLEGPGGESFEDVFKRIFEWKLRTETLRFPLRGLFIFPSRPFQKSSDDGDEGLRSAISALAAEASRVLMREAGGARKTGGMGVD